MPSSDIPLQFRLFGSGGAVYPGHAVTLAYAIMQAYPSLEAALTRRANESFPEALGNNDIPGAGGCVYSALEILRLAYSVGLDAAFERGDEIWLSETQTAYTDRRLPGQIQADGLKEAFRTIFASWQEKTPVTA